MKIYDILHENNSEQFPWLIVARVAANDEDSALQAWAEEEAYESVEALLKDNKWMGKIKLETLEITDAIVLKTWDWD